MQYSFGQQELDCIQESLESDLIKNGVHCALLIDMSGNIIVNLDNGNIGHDIYSLAALAAGNFGAINAIANIIGEESFSILFHKGEKENIHFSKVTTDFLLITIFGQEISLGYLRMKVAQSIGKIGKVLVENEK